MIITIIKYLFVCLLVYGGYLFWKGFDFRGRPIPPKKFLSISIFIFAVLLVGPKEASNDKHSVSSVTFKPGAVGEVTPEYTIENMPGISSLELLNDRNKNSVPATQEEKQEAFEGALKVISQYPRSKINLVSMNIDYPKEGKKYFVVIKRADGWTFSEEFDSSGSKALAPTSTAERDQKIIAERSNRNEKVAALKRQIKKDARDPDSIQFRNEAGGCFEYSGKNAFGGYANWEYICAK
jgi:hypothetical protein